MAEAYKSKYLHLFDTVEDEQEDTASGYKSKYLHLYEPVSSDGPTIEDQTQEAFTAPEGVRDLTRDDVFAKFAPYMKRKFGMTEDKHDRQEIVDSYVNHMRKFNFGQSVVTLEELAYLNKIKNTDDEVERAAMLTEAMNAYDTFDSMKNAFAEGTTFAEKADAVGDYARALIVDPVNLVSLGVGKLVSGGAMKAAQQAAKYAIRDQATDLIKRKGYTEGVRREIAQMEARAMGDVIKSGVFKTAGKEVTTKQIARREAVGAGLSDTVAGVGMDAIYQNIMQDVDLQDNYSLMQGSLTAAGGLFGVGLGYSFARGFKMSESDLSALGAMRFTQAQEYLANARKLAGSAEHTIKDLDMPGFEASLPGFRDMFETLKDKAARGEPLRMTDAGDYVPDDLVWQDTFFKGVAQALADNGVKYWAKRNPNDGFLNWMSDLMVAMPDNVKAQLSDIFDDSLGKNVELYKGKKLFEEVKDADGNVIAKTALDLVASEISEAATKMAIVRHASSVFNKVKEITPDAEPDELIKELIKVDLPAAPRRVANSIKSGAEYMQRNLIRMLVTHPGTTALNLIGWQTASSMQSAADIVRGTLYGTTAILNAAMFNREGAAKYAKKAGLMFSLQKDKMRNLLDPNMTYQQFMDFLAFNPSAQKDMMRYMAGGVDIEELSRKLQLEEFSDLAKDALGADNINAINRNTLDKIMDKIQVVYGVKLQDVVTKSQEFMYAIDKQMRLKYDMTYSEFLQDPNMWKRMMGDDYAEIVSTASQDALRNVFSKSYAGKNPTGQIAGFIESMSRMPFVGAMVPFGQFFNNTIAHMMDHTGISLAHKFWAGTTRDPMELATKTAVGLSLMGVAYQYEKDNLDDGLAWYQDRGSDGAIRNRLYDFPYVFYKAVGRMAAHIERDGTVPQPLFEEIAKTFGPGALTRQLDQNIKGMYDLIVEAVTTDDPDYGEALVKVVQNTTAMYTSGYTRFLEPVNLTAAMLKGQGNVTPDRKQGAEWVNNSVRYADELLESMSLYTRPEKRYDPLSQEDRNVPIGKIFGMRYENAQSPVQKAFNEVGRPQWQTEIQSNIPVARNEVNRIIQSVLNYEVSELMDMPKWKAGTTQEKLEYLNQRIQQSKSFVKEILGNAFDPEDTRTLLLFKLGAGEYANQSRLNQYKKELGIEEEFTDLELPQLQLFVSFVETKEDLRKEKRKQ